MTAETMTLYPKVYGPDHPYLHGCAGNLALIHRARGDAAAARELNQKSLAGLDARLGRDHNYPLTVAINLASDYAALDQPDAARELGQDTLVRVRQVLGEDRSGPIPVSGAKRAATVAPY